MGSPWYVVYPSSMPWSSVLCSHTLEKVVVLVAVLISRPVKSDNCSRMDLMVFRDFGLASVKTRISSTYIRSVIDVTLFKLFVYAFICLSFRSTLFLATSLINCNIVQISENHNELINNILFFLFTDLLTQCIEVFRIMYCSISSTLETSDIQINSSIWKTHWLYCLSLRGYQTKFAKRPHST